MCLQNRNRLIEGTRIQTQNCLIYHARLPINYSLKSTRSKPPSLAEEKCENFKQFQSKSML